MVTLGNFIEFEHAVPKMAHPSASAVSMIAGDTLVGTRLAREVATDLAGSTPTATDIAKALCDRYEQVRQERMEHQVLVPRGLNLQTFYGNHANFNPSITMMLDEQMASFTLNVELLLAGVDGDEAHIFTVHNPGGNPLQHDVIGYAAIGSGALHATQTLIGFGHHGNVPLKETVLRTYTAKRRAEVAPGVGHDTDMAILSDAKTEWLTADQLNQLADLYDAFEDETDKALTGQLDSLELETPEGGTDGDDTNGGDHAN